MSPRHAIAPTRKCARRFTALPLPCGASRLPTVPKGEERPLYAARQDDLRIFLDGCTPSGTTWTPAIEGEPQ